MRLNLIVIIFLFLVSINGYAQPSENKREDSVKEISKPILPHFTGGDVAFYDFLDKNVKLPQGFDKEKYLSEHHNQFVPISVGFTVDIDGSISNIKVIDGEDESLNTKAIEIVQKMPKWKPGSKNGSPIKVEFAIPIRFNLM